MKTILEAKMEMVKRHKELAECLKNVTDDLLENQKKSDDYNKEMEKRFSDFDKKDKDIEQKIVLANKNLKYFSDNLAIFLITYNRKDWYLSFVIDRQI